MERERERQQEETSRTTVDYMRRGNEDIVGEDEET